MKKEAYITSYTACVSRKASKALARRLGVFLVSALILAACVSPPVPPAPHATHTAPPTQTAALAADREQPPTATPTARPTATQPPPLPSETPEPPFAVCSPLEGITLAELDQPDLLKNSFEQPRPGIDDGHHGVDFAYWSRGERSTMQGLPVYAVLAGRVAGVLDNRMPYGYAVIVETPLDGLPEDFLTSLDLPAPQPTVQPAPNLVCPPDPLVYGQPDRRSLYLLYAHFDKPAAVSAGQTVACGEQLGEVGTTGRSVNFHLHLEARVGPAGAEIPSLAHYENSASVAEMSAYCTWRVSGLFALFDPMRILR